MKLQIPFFNRAVKGMKDAATAAVMSIAGSILHITRENLWRDTYNPLRGLTMSRVVSYLEEGERGAYADIQWIYRMIEKRDAVLRGGKRSLLGAVAEKDWEVRQCPEEKLPPGYAKSDAEAQVKTLRAAYDRIDNMRQAIEHLALAEFRGYAHLEKHYADGGPNDGACVHLEPVEQWYLCRKGTTGPWHYNATAASGRTTGLEIPVEHWIIREVEDPINEIALIAFVRKNLSLKDWDGYVEAFGIPSIFAIMPPNVPSGKESEYQSMAEQIIGNSRGALPHGSDIKSVPGGEKGSSPFLEHLEYQDQQIVLAITSGLLTMLAESGSGTLAGGAHSQTFDRIVRALAKRVSETFQAQFDKPLLAEAHPNQPVLAWFEISANEEEDTGAFLDNVVKVKQAGFTVDPEQITEKTGLELVETQEPEEKDPVPPVANRRTFRIGGVVLNYNPAQARDAYGRFARSGMSGKISDDELAAAGIPEGIRAKFKEAQSSKFDIDDEDTWPADLKKRQKAIKDSTPDDEVDKLYQEAEERYWKEQAVQSYVYDRLEKLGSIANRDASLKRVSDELGVPPEWNAPIANLWAEIEAKIQDKSLSDADLITFLEQAADKLPELWADMDKEALAEVLTSALGAAAVEGLRDSLKKS